MRKQPKIKSPSLPYTPKAASFLGDIETSVNPFRPIRPIPQIGSSTSRRSKPGLLGGV